jgi:hypothetical protein
MTTKSYSPDLPPPGTGAMNPTLSADIINVVTIDEKGGAVVVDIQARGATPGVGKETGFFPALLLSEPCFRFTGVLHQTRKS